MKKIHYALMHKFDNKPEPVIVGIMCSYTSLPNRSRVTRNKSKVTCKACLKATE